jgi:hypothetical protein
MEHVVDLILLSQYKDHDVDDDPILFLRCGHFFTVATLDGLLKMNEVYEFDPSSNEYVSVRSIRGVDVSDKPLACPDCIMPIVGLFRYGRMLNLSTIRGLQRKHMMGVDGKIDSLSKKSPAEIPLDVVSKVLNDIRRSPMQVIFEACAGSSEVEVPNPPSRPHLRALELMALIHSSKTEKVGDDDYLAAQATYTEAIGVAMGTSSLRFAAVLKLALLKFWMRFVKDGETLKRDAAPHLEWVVGQSQFQELVTEAKALQDRVRLGTISREEVADVVKAMSIGGYNYGTSASSHWYQCPNGHPYFIGECGGAMQESTCNECGESIGGAGHFLLPTNRTADNLLSRIGPPTS